MGTIPKARWHDGNAPVPTTQFPQAVGLGETWDVDVLRRVAEIESIESRYAFQSDKYRRGGLVVRAPNADLARDPRWGRTEESYGEDPFLTGTLATAFVRGLQGNDPKESVDRKSLDLEQESLIKKVLAANRRTIVVLISSFPNTINWTETHVPAIMLMTHNSQESGNALADVLFGDFNPAGRLVHTWPRSIDQLPPMMDYDIRHSRTYWYFKGTPLYPFGFGLSYTRFHYFRMRTDAAVLPADGSVDVSVDVGNVGNRDGEEVVQLYVQLPQSKISRPERSLKAFQRVALRAGEIRTLHLRLAARDLAYWDVAAHRFVVEAGRVRLLVGASSSDIRLRKVVQMSAALALSPNLQQAYVIN